MTSMLDTTAADRLHELLHDRGINAPRETVEDMVRGHGDGENEPFDLTPAVVPDGRTDEALVALADAAAHATSGPVSPSHPVPLKAAAEFTASLMHIVAARAHRAHPADQPAITDALAAADHFQQRICEAANDQAVETITVSPKALHNTARLIEAAARQTDLVSPPPGADESAEQARTRLLDDATAARFLAVRAVTP